MNQLQIFNEMANEKREKPRIILSDSFPFTKADKQNVTSATVNSESTIIPLPALFHFVFANREEEMIEKHVN